MTEELRSDVSTAMEENRETKSRLTGILSHLEIATSRWYYRPIPPSKRKPTVRVPLTVPAENVAAIISMAEDNPWYGYKKIAVMCRRSEVDVSNRQVFRVMKKNGLLQKRSKTKPAELHQALKLYELLPEGPNDLWQTDVTYIHIPGYGWWYAVTVIDYYSRYLLSCRLTWSYSASEVIVALDEARKEAERLTGPLKKPPFLVSEFRGRYNYQRPHWALIPEAGGDPHTPYEVYAEGALTKIPKWQGWAKRAKEKLEQMMKEAS